MFVYVNVSADGGINVGFEVVTLVEYNKYALFVSSDETLIFKH
jgi:hypothetical protein